MAVLVGLAPMLGLAQSAPSLFLPDDAPQVSRAAVPRSAGSGIRRARMARINPAILSDPASPLHHPSPAALGQPGSRLGLGLFADRNLSAVIERTDYLPGGRFSARGVVEGVPGSIVLISGNQEAMAATVQTPGADVAQIIYAGDGTYQIAELDPAESTSCGAISAPKPTGGDGGSGGAVIPAGDAANTVDVMVVYTAAARTGAGGTAGIQSQIDLAIAEANTCYANSGLGLTLNLVYRGEVSYTETSDASTDLTRLQATSDGKLDTVHTLRAQYGADLVCLVVEGMNTYAGLGYIMSPVSTNFAAYGFSVVKRQYLTGAYTFPHELGHNMGCNHDRDNASGSGAQTYSYGYRFDASGSTYRSVMAYAPGTRIAYFSNPDVSYLGTATGVAVGQLDEANNALSLSNSVATVSAFFDSATIINFTTNAVSIAENGGTLSLTLERTGTLTNACSIKVATAAGTAKANTDFTAISTTVSFAAGETNKTVNIAIVNDALAESDETFSVTLSAPVGAAAGANSPVTVTIVEDDIIVSLASATYSLLENATNAVLSLVRTGTTNGTASVDFATTALTATSDADYTNTTGTVTFAAGETAATITVPVINDTEIESSETFRVTLSNPTNAVVGTVSSSTVTILEDDVEFLFGSPLLSVIENVTSATVAVTRRGGTSVTNTVAYATTTNSTATAGSDYTAASGTLTFKPGATSANIVLTLSNDSAVEDDETVELELANPDAGASLASSNTTAVITIRDNDSVFGWEVVTNEVAENAGKLTLNVVRSGGVAGAATVGYASGTNGTATAGTDFKALAGKLSFKAGETNKAVVVTVVNDGQLEGDEAFEVTLSGPTGEGTVGTNGVASVTLLDDDLYSFELATNAVSVAENGTNVTFTVTRSGATNATSVKYATVAGTAKAGADFTAASGTLEFADGETEATVTVTVLDDVLIEKDETFTFALNTPGTNGVLGAVSATVVTVAEDDASVSLASAKYNVLESATNVVLSLVRTGTTNGTVSVDYATADGTALADADYTNTTGTVTFAAGETAATITVPVVNDTEIEASETFTLALLSPTNTYLGKLTNAVVTIIEDDVEFIFGTPLVSVIENVATAKVTVTRRGGTTATNTVDYATTTNSTATAASDFTAASGTLTFKSGVTSATLTVAILNDTSIEGDETVELALTNPDAGASLASSNTTAVITILDNDSLFDFAVTTNTVAENAGTVSLSVTRTGGVAGAAAVTYATADGTATNALDYTGVTKLLSFKAGETNKVLTVKIINDTAVETNETFTVTLSAPTGEGQLGTNNVTTVTITDNDGGGDVPDQHVLRIAYLEDGTRLLRIEGDIRGKVTIEGSSDFIQWTALSQVEMTTGSAEWIDPDTSEEASTCYRIWVMPGD